MSETLAGESSEAINVNLQIQPASQPRVKDFHIQGKAIIWP